MNQNVEFKYLTVARRIEKMIEGGVLNVGDKLLSVRALSREQGISMSTAFQAYYHLEGKGLIEARPKSGYYVKFSPKQFPALPRVYFPQEAPKQVSVAEMITAVYGNFSSEEIIRFSVAMPSLDLLPVAKINKAVVHALRSQNHCIPYANIQGDVSLRRQLARLAFNWGGNITKEDILITAGCMEAVTFCLNAITCKGDTVAIESPTYFGIFQVIQSLGLKVLEIPTHPQTGIDLAFLEKAIPKYQIKACLFVTNFNNPLGCLMPEETKKDLVYLLERLKVPLIENDIYGELYFGKTRPKACKSYDRTGNVLYCASLSKSLAPGYRIGWTIPGRYKEQIIQHKLYQNISTASITQSALGHFLEKGRFEFHMRNLRKALHTQCLRYIQAIIRHFPKDTRVSRPQGGFVLWVELNSSIDAFQLYQKAIKRGISIAPGQIFSVQGQYSNYIRLSFGATFDEKVERGISVLGQLVHRYIEYKS